MAKTEMRDGELYVYCEEEDTWFPKYKEKNGLRMELDEKYFVYVLEGHTLDESMANGNGGIDESYTGLIIPGAAVDDDDEEDDEIMLSPFYGLARRQFLKDNSFEYYRRMLIEDTLQDHLQDIEKRACDMEDRLVKQYMEKEGVTNELKSRDYEEWIGRYNNIVHRVRNVVQEELIFI